jgi:seryl-tRNA synthetase
VKIFIFLLATTTSPDDNMDLGSNANNTGEGNGGDERRPSEEGAGGSRGKDKGKGKMTEAQEEDEERECEERARKVLEQRREEIMSQVASALAAENKTVRNAQAAIANLTQALSEMQQLDAAHPRFARELTLDLVNTNRSLTPSGPVGDEDDSVSEDPSERDPMTVYSEDENQEGASQ